MQSSPSPSDSPRQDPILVDTLIVGFGFSVIPLLRELEARGQEYTLLSDGQPIWQQLAASDRLNFDLVSSFHASFYVPDQVEADVIDNYYPTAQEFFDYHERFVNDTDLDNLELFAASDAAKTNPVAASEAKSDGATATAGAHAPAKPAAAAPAKKAPAKKAPAKKAAKKPGKSKAVLKHLKVGLEMATVL